MAVSVSYVYDTILTLIRKDQQGNSFNIPEYNNLIKLVNLELYNFYVSKIEQDADNTNVMYPFIKRNVQITLTGGVGELPSVVHRLLGKPWYISGSDTIPFDMVTSVEFAERMKDELTKPTEDNPIVILGTPQDDDNITVYPSTLTSIRFDYLLLPTTPLLDYYILSTGQYVYLDAGATNITIPVGAVYSDGVTTNPSTVNSLTVDFQWHQDEIPILIDSVLQKAGLILENQAPIEYGIAKQIKEEQQ